MTNYTLESLGFNIQKEVPSTNDEFDALTGAENSACAFAVNGWMGTTFAARWRNKFIERVEKETERKRPQGQSQASFIADIATDFDDEGRNFYDEFQEIAQEVALQCEADFKAQRGGGDGGTRAPTKKAVELFEATREAGRLEALAESANVELVDLPDGKEYTSWTDEQLECRNRLANELYARYKAKIAKLEAETLI